MLKFLLHAMTKNLCKEPDGRSSKGMPDQHKLCSFIPPVNQRTARKISAEPFMPVLRAVLLTIVHPRAGKLCVQFTGPVPGAAMRGNGRSITIESFFSEKRNQIAVLHPPVWSLLVFLIVAAPAGQTVYKNVFQTTHFDLIFLF